MTDLFALGLVLTTWGWVGLLCIPEYLRHEDLMAKKRERAAWRSPFKESAETEEIEP
jgi:hypothetical protein